MREARTYKGYIKAVRVGHPSYTRNAPMAKATSIAAATSVLAEDELTRKLVRVRRRLSSLRLSDRLHKLTA